MYTKPYFKIYMDWKGSDTNMKYRHEWKHEIHYGDMLILRQRLAAIAKRDSYAISPICHAPICRTPGQTKETSDAQLKKSPPAYQKGTSLVPCTAYEVRSLYFDNISDKALREKIDGVKAREKFRIRCYNRDYAFIRLEKKSKLNGLCLKENAIITAKQVDSLLHGDYGWMAGSGVPLAAELYAKMMGQGLRPKTIVDYTREPFVFSPGNVRITLDYNIRTGMHSTDFLNPNCVTVPAGDSNIILEVKWDDFLPDIIRDAVQLKGCRVGAFSKYAACRAYG